MNHSPKCRNQILKLMKEDTREFLCDMKISSLSTKSMKHKSWIGCTA